MKKLLVGIVTLVAAVVLTSPAFGALSLAGYDVTNVGSFYFDEGIGVTGSMPVSHPPNEENVISQLTPFWGEITFSEKFDDLTGTSGSITFNYPVQIVVAKWGGNPNENITSYAFLLDGYTKEFGWDLDVQYAMSHVGGYNAVPVPAAVWLLGSGVLGLVAIKRRRS